jgi:hypothetical protein
VTKTGRSTNKADALRPDVVQPMKDKYPAGAVRSIGMPFEIPPGHMNGKVSIPTVATVPCLLNLDHSKMWICHDNIFNVEN